MDYIKEQKKLIREEKRLQKLGNENPVCCLCGYLDPIGLIKADKTLLEKHHLAGRHEGPTVLVCRNCHAKLTDIQVYEYGEFIEPDRNPLEISASYVNGVGIFLSLLAVSLIIFAKWLLELSKRVDESIFEGLPYPLGGGFINE